jgi:hypothetical protein
LKQRIKQKVVKGSINGQDFSLPIEEIDINKYTVHLDDKNYQTLDIILPIIDFEVVSNIEGGDLVLNGNKIGTIEDGRAQLTRILLSTDEQVIEVNKEFSNRSLNEKAKISKEDNQSTIEINSSDIFGKEQILEQLNQIGQSMPLRIDEKFLTSNKTSDLQEKIASEMSAVHADFEKKTSFDVNLTNCDFSIQEIEQTDSDSYLVKATYRINSTTSWSQKGAFGLVSTTNTNDNEPVDGKYTTWVLKNEEGILKVSDIQ